MKTAALALTLALCATPVLADPFGEALDAADGSLCFQQAETRPEGQQWKSVRLSYVRDAEGIARLRLRLEGSGKPLLIHGSCAWMPEINRGGAGASSIRLSCRPAA